MSCVSLKALNAAFGSHEVQKQIYKSGYNPVFKTASGGLASPVGQIRLHFETGGVLFKHVFYVMDSLSHPVILGNTFLKQTSAVVDYVRGELVLQGEGAKTTSVPFGSQECASLQPLLVHEFMLLAKSEFTVPARSWCYAPAYVRGQENSADIFGDISPRAMGKLQTPAAVAKLKKGETNLLFVNLSTHARRVRRNFPVASFQAKDSSSMDIFSIDMDTMMPRDLSALDDSTEHNDELCAQLVEDDKFVPYTGPDDPNLSKIARWTKEEVDKMSPAEIQKEYEKAPLSLLQFGSKLPPEELLGFRKLILQHRDVFGRGDAPGLANEAGCTIDTGDAQPQVYPLRRTLPHIRPLIDEHIDLMLEHKIIEPSTSPWAAAVLMIPKKSLDGKPSWRFCLDYRALNKVTKRQAYPLPKIDDALASLSGNKYFTCLDATSGYWNIPMRTEEDRDKTSFNCHRGSFRFLRMPFGLQNAPSQFQAFMDHALRGLNFRIALIFLDDVLVYSKDFASHIRDIGLVLDCLRKAGLQLKAKKCQIGADQVAYLGHVVSSMGVHPDPRKVHAITSFQPRTRRDLSSFVGMSGYYRKFIRNYAKIARPLHHFVDSRKPFVGVTAEMAASIAAIKEALTSEPILAHPDFTRDFEIHSDASKHAIGATLVQNIGGSEKVIMYASRVLRKHEQNYNAHEKEGLALVWACGVFRPYVLVRRCKAVVDNSALTQLFKKKDSSRMVRWALSLSEYEIEYCHRPGVKHADRVFNF